MKKLFIYFIILLFVSHLSGEEKTFLQKANEYFNQGKFALAEIFYKKGIEQKPDDFQANYNLAKIYFFKKEYKKAIKFFQTAYDLKSNKEIQFHIANCYANLKQPKQALTIYSNLIKKYPDYADVYLNAGNIGLKQLYNKYITIANWEKFLQLKPNDPQAPNIRKALAYLKDPNFILKPPIAQKQDGKPSSSTSSQGTTSTSASSKVNIPILPEIKSKELESKSEERYNLMKKKGITTE